MTQQELDCAILRLVYNSPKYKTGKRGRRFRRKTKNLKDTKLYNELLNVGYAYRTKWASEYYEYGGVAKKRIEHVKSLRGTGFYLKGCDSDRRKTFKRMSARRFRRKYRRQGEVPDGNTSRRMALDMAWELI